MDEEILDGEIMENESLRMQSCQALLRVSFFPKHLVFSKPKLG